VAAFEAWLVFLILMLLANLNGKEHLRHRAVSLRQHGFLVCYTAARNNLMGITSDTHIICFEFNHKIIDEDKYCSFFQVSVPLGQQQTPLL